MTVFDNSTWFALGEALLHSLWQGLSIFLLLRLLLFIFKNEDSAMKYSLSVIAMATIVISFAGTFILCLKPSYSIESAVSAASSGTLLITVLPVNKAVESSSLVGAINFDRIITLFLPAYLIIVILMLLKIGLSYFRVRTIRSRGIIHIGECNQKFEYLIQHFNLSQKVQIRFSEVIDVPMMMGFFKPLVLIPVALINNLSAEQVEAIIMHELAHIKRNDYIVNLFQRLTETIFFFNPFVWMISYVIRTERENSCDDLVVKFQNNPLNYAEALYALEHNRLNSYALALGATNKKNHLLKRIHRIMETRKTNPGSYRNTNSKYLLAASLIILSFISVAWLVPQDTLKNKKPVKKEVIVKPPVPSVPPLSANEIVAPPAPPVPAPDAVDAVAPTPEIPMAPPAAPVQPPLPPDSLKRTKQITFIDDDGKVRQYNSYNDIPEADKEEIEREMAKELEHAQAELKRAQSEMEKVNFKKLSKEMEQAQKDHKQAMKNIDQKKMENEMNQAMKEYEYAMENFNDAKLNKEQAEENASLRNLSALQMEKEMERLSRLQYVNDKEMDKMRKRIDTKAMLQTQEEMKRAMAEKEIAIEKERSGIKQNITLSNINEMISKMENEKLISRDAGFIIQKSDGDLYINNEKQSDELNERYLKYTGKADLKVKGKNNELKISGDHYEFNVSE